MVELDFRFEMHGVLGGIVKEIEMAVGFLGLLETALVEVGRFLVATHEI